MIIIKCINKQWRRQDLQFGGGG